MKLIHKQQHTAKINRMEPHLSSRAVFTFEIYQNTNNRQFFAKISLAGMEVYRSAEMMDLKVLSTAVKKATNRLNTCYEVAPKMSFIFLEDVKAYRNQQPINVALTQSPRIPFGLSDVIIDAFGSVRLKIDPDINPTSISLSPDYLINLAKTVEKKLKKAKKNEGVRK